MTSLFFLGARFLATLAVQMQTVAVGWQVYETTRDPLDLGLIGLSQFLPFVLLILPAGQSLLPNLVPRAQFGTAVALNSSTWARDRRRDGARPARRQRRRVAHR